MWLYSIRITVVAALNIYASTQTAYRQSGCHRWSLLLALRVRLRLLSSQSPSGTAEIFEELAVAHISRAVEELDTRLLRVTLRLGEQAWHLLLLDLRYHPSLQAHSEDAVMHDCIRHLMRTLDPVGHDNGACAPTAAAALFLF